MAEFTEPQIEELESAGNMDEKLVGTISQYCLPTWEVYVDEVSNQKGSGIGLVLISPEKVIVEGHLWKAQWKEKPNDEGHRKLTMNS